MSSSAAAPPIESSTDDWLRVPAAAKKLGLSHPRTLYRLTEQRLIPFRRLPGTSIKAFAPEDLDEIAKMSLVAPLRQSA